MNMIRQILIMIIILVVFSSSLYAQGPCHQASVSCENMRISICPRNDFEYVRNSCGGNSDYIEIWATDYAGYGIPGIPTTDYWMDSCDPSQSLAICVWVTADSITSNTPGYVGRTTISGRIRGGGCALSGGILLYIQGMAVLDESCWNPRCLSIQMVSPDINGDQVVDLSDLGVFGISYNKAKDSAEYNDCCDFNDDEECDLRDFAFFGQHYQHVCF